MVTADDIADELEVWDSPLRAAYLAALAGAFQFHPGCWHKRLSFTYTATGKEVTDATAAELVTLSSLGFIGINDNESYPRFCTVGPPNRT